MVTITNKVGPNIFGRVYYRSFYAITKVINAIKIEIQLRNP